ncbi:MAG: hypothetical protein IT181_15655 [Acidobacteria bacterium]|nr:hypothetical protein [Acidobacteriota bacterium]
MQTRALSAMVAVAAALANWSCGGSGGGLRIPQVTPQSTETAADPARAALEGEWRLVSMDTAGGPRQVTGFLRYDRFSTLTVHAELAAGDPAARAPQTVVAAFTAKASPASGAFDYAGLTETVGRERLTPDAVDMREWRYFEVDGDTLRVSARGGPSAATLVFQRAR